MRIAITGASGFVGRHLIDALSMNHEIVAISRSALELPRGVEKRVVDSIDSLTDWSGVLEDIDVVVHLAARVHVMNETKSDPLEAFREINVRGTTRLADACVEQGVRRLIFMSSIKVNGERTEGRPFTSLDTPCPVDPYGISKWEAEQLLSTVGVRTGLAIKILRSPVVYGPGVKGNISRLARLVRTGAPLPFGRISNRRTMISIENLLRWIEHAVLDESDSDGPILIGDVEPVSTRDLVKWIGEGMSARPRLIPIPSRLLEFAASIFGFKSTIERLTQDLEVAPDYDAFPGIQSILEHPRTGLQRLGQALSSKR